MKKQKIGKVKLIRLLTYLVMAAAIAAASGSFFLYAQSVEKAVYGATVSFMEQIADHDRQNVVNQLNNKWEYIDSIIERVSLNRDATLEEVIYELGVETNATTFDKLYLVTDDETVYSSSYLEKTLAEMPWSTEFSHSSEHFVMRHNEDGREEWGEYLIYGNHLLEPVVCGTKKIVGVVGLVTISQITEQLRLESFDGQGLAIVMQPSGDIITSVQNYPVEKNNFLTILEGADFKGGGSLEACRNAVSANEKLFVEYATSEGDFYALFQPIGGESGDWYLVLNVNKEVTNKQVRSIILRSLPFFLFLALILSAVAFFFYRNVKEVSAARSAERAKSAFLANMSHEIRTPLNGLVGLQYLMRQNLNDPEKMDEYLKKAELSADYLKSIITDVLDMSKIESGQLELFEKEVDLRKLVVEVRTVLGTQAEEKGQIFCLDAENIPHPYVKGDDIRIKQVLTNLLGNALKFTPSGGEIDLIVSQTVEGNDAVTTFVVRDTGCGMNPEFLQRIWQPFEQEQRVASINGTGLGTTLSKTLVEKMGGAIQVESKPNEGTKFTVTIPFPIVANPETSETAGTAERWELNGKRVLVAEDNLINRMIVTAILKEQGCDVTEAVDGAEAVELFKKSPENHFDLILMDVQMPVMDGMEATRRIRSLRPDGAKVTIIATTANAFRADVEQALECGMNDVVTKPIDVTLLLSKIKNLRENGE